MSHDDESRDIQSLLQQAHDTPLPEPGFVRQLGERMARELSGMRATSEPVRARAPGMRRRRWLLIPAAAAAIAFFAVATHFWRQPGEASRSVKDIEIAQVNPKDSDNKEGARPPNVYFKQPPRTSKESLRRESSLSLALREGLGSFEQRVTDAQVIVVATALDSALAPPKVPGDLPENLIRFKVKRVLKGKLDDKEITTRTPTAPVEFIGKDWVVLLSPEYMARKHQFAMSCAIQFEPNVKAILASAQKLMKHESLRVPSLEQRVAEAQVIVVATGLDSALAPPEVSGDLPEVLIRWQVKRVLKGELGKKEITIRTSTAAAEFIGKEWIIFLTPDYLAEKHQRAACLHIQFERDVKAILASAQKNGWVEGQLLLGEKPGAGQLIVLQTYEGKNDPDGESPETFEATTDAEGRFVFERIPRSKTKGTVNVAYPQEGGGWVTVHGLNLEVEIMAGKTTKVTIGGKGRPVIGEVVLPAEAKFSADKVRVRYNLKAPHIGFPEDEKLWKAYGEWLRSAVTKQYKREDGKIDAKGRFRFEGVPAGTYQLVAYVPESDTNTELVFKKFTVPPMPGGSSDKALDLGKLEAPKKH